MDFYRDFNITLAAGEVRPIVAYGSYLTILENNTVTDMIVSLDGNAGQAIPAGISVELPADQKYSGFYVANPSGGAMTVRFAISAGRIVDSRLKAAATLNVAVLSGTIADLTSVKNNSRSLNGDTGAQIVRYATIGASAVATVYQVTAGKTLYLTGFNVGGSVVGAYGLYLAWTDSAFALKQYLFVGIGQAGVTLPIGVCQNLSTPIKIAATDILRITSGATSVGNATIFGWEE
jgi:hypothetical protein